MKHIPGAWPERRAPLLCPAPDQTHLLAQEASFRRLQRPLAPALLCVPRGQKKLSGCLHRRPCLLSFRAVWLPGESLFPQLVQGGKHGGFLPRVWVTVTSLDGALGCACSISKHMFWPPRPLGYTAQAEAEESGATRSPSQACVSATQQDAFQNTSPNK